MAFPTLKSKISGNLKLHFNRAYRNWSFVFISAIFLNTLHMDAKVKHGKESMEFYVEDVLDSRIDNFTASRYHKGKFYAIRCSIF